MPDKNLTRIRRQFTALERFAPPAKRIIDPLLKNGMRWVRLPASILLLVGGVFSFLPILGLWMLPLGFMLLAVDVPAMRPGVAAAAIWVRRRRRRMFRRGKRDNPAR